MARLIVIHWNADEGQARAVALGTHGHSVTAIRPEGGKGLARYRTAQPDAFVIDLSRLPSHGRAVAVYLRQTKGTRDVPLLFVAGALEKVAKIKAVLPDATYVRTWRGVAGGVKRAMASRSLSPIVPPSISGYSGTPLPKKLGIKPGARLALLGAPDDFQATLGPLPDDVQIKHQARGPADVILLFTRSQSELDRRLPAAQRAMAPGARLWLAWPKKASGLKTDLSSNVIRTTGLGNGLMDYKVCAIDTTWSGLCFARQKQV